MVACSSSYIPLLKRTDSKLTSLGRSYEDRNIRNKYGRLC
jgi:hypothetical protein